MPSDLFNDYGSGKNVPNNQMQNPRDAAIDLMRKQGITIPQGMGNNPNAILQHLMQSGMIPQGRLNAAQQILQKMINK